MNPTKPYGARGIWLALVSFSFLSVSVMADTGGYGPLPAKGCPARSQFRDNHFQAMAPLDGCADRDLSALSSRIIRGGEPYSKGIDCLQKSDVIAVIDLRTEGEHRDEAAQVTAAGMSYYAFPMSTDDGWEASKECTSRGMSAAACDEKNSLAAIDRIKEILSANPTGKIYVHCAHGEDRTGLMLGLFRLLAQRCSSTEARAEMRAFGYSPYAPLAEVWAKYTE